ncbi:MAG: AAA family ATPase [Myxococcota bacterium]|nr:AAA family ATPase [Myxococcota bacterium]
MRFTRLELLNWDIQANQVVVLQPGVNLLTGENGSGKTTILDAIKVVLGGTRIGGDRSVEDYLAARAEPFAMIRLVADNEPDPGTRKRPFDVVQPSEEDHFTLAVVYEAGDEGYTPSWYFCPGDVSPLQRGFDGRSFTRKGDYTARLEKLGMGRSFRKLLCTPQGQVASLCQHDPDDLFDLLFDFIGGKQVLDDWETLRKDFERQQRNRDDRGQVLQRREAELDGLRNLLRAHKRYRGHLQRLHLARHALPLAKLAEAKAELRRLDDHIAELEARSAAATTTAQLATERLTTIAQDEAETKDKRTTLDSRGRELDARWKELQEDKASTEAGLRPLEMLRKEVEHLEPRDLNTLTEARTQCEDQQADLRRELSELAARENALREELQRLDEGLLTPPDGVDEFRAVLRKHDIPHHLLLDLVEPQSPDPRTRQALESFLADFRFAVAVPDVHSFVQAIRLARSHRFPFYVLAPDVRSRAPTSGEHPFLDQIQVRDPKYRGLVTRVLRHVRWLDGDIEDTHRGPGFLVDGDGFVLDRKGGRFQGTDRYYLGREALVQRRAQVEEELEHIAAMEREAHTRRVALAADRVALNTAIAEEEERRRWLAARTEHARLTARVTRLEGLLGQLDEERSNHQAQLSELELRLRTLHGDRVREEGARDRANEAAKTDGERASQARRERTTLVAHMAELDVPEPDQLHPEVVAHATEHPVAVLEHTVRTNEQSLKSFQQAERDTNLPANVETLEKQVADVAKELALLDENVDRAREAAERAHDQYRTATRRIFRRYFASLTQSGGPLGFTIEGGLRARDDGRFAVDVKIAAGAKDLVPYSSPSLSGGQKAALSMLMAMTTLRVHDADGGPGFFLVDEPFSASDTHKIQELGAFLERTGAQYLVSMPTTEELRRCGSWLQAVLTCTQTPGGRTTDGQLRIAPPVKCSYVVRHVD